MYRRALIPGAIVVLLSVSLTNAEPFVRPPENDPIIPPDGWVSPFRYPRNILIDFGTDPNTWPPNPNPNEPADSVDLVDGQNYHLEGWDDVRLSGSDWARWEGEFDWLESYAGRDGVAGIFERIGQVTCRLHLDNEPEPRPVKHLWAEFEYYFEGPGRAEWFAEVVLPPEYEWGFTWDDEAIPGTPWRRRNFWVWIEPNPPWEELTIVLGTGPTAAATVLFDYAHIATECVPEPGTCTLLGAGSLGLMVWLWRRRRRAK